MSTRELLLTLLLAVLAELSLLAAFVFLGTQVGVSAPEFHAVDLGYLAIPLLLAVAALSLPTRELLRRRRRRRP